MFIKETLEMLKDKSKVVKLFETDEENLKDKLTELIIEHYKFSQPSELLNSTALNFIKYASFSELQKTALKVKVGDFLYTYELVDFPEPGSMWINTNQNKLYTVIGKVCQCADTDDWMILYRDLEWPIGEYRYRSISEWYGLNRNGDQRFIPKLD